MSLANSNWSVTAIRGQLSLVYVFSIFIQTWLNDKHTNVLLDHFTPAKGNEEEEKTGFL